MLSRKCRGDAGHQFGSEAATNGIASQRQRQPGDFLPPLSEIDDAMQAGLVVGQLAFVNDEAGLLLAFEHLRNDLIEGHDVGFDSGGEKFEHQVRRS